VFVLNIATMVGLGVGIDYSLLIVTRLREEMNRGLAPLDAAVRTVQTAGAAVVTSGVTVVVGFAALVTTPLIETRSATASTITFAAAIMVIVFGVFSFSRVLAVQFLGFGLAVAVLLDATLLRIVLVPAIMHIAGRWNWWPGVRMPQARPDA
jgi:uncharacterized membrane protein YdfJ with MMPL/SSD domain